MSSVGKEDYYAPDEKLPFTRVGYKGDDRTGETFGFPCVGKYGDKKGEGFKIKLSGCFY